MEEAQTSDPKVIVLDVDSGSNTSTAAKDLKEKGSLQINKIERHLSRKRMRRAISLADSTSRKLSCRNTWGLKGKAYFNNKTYYSFLLINIFKEKASIEQENLI